MYSLYIARDFFLQKRQVLPSKTAWRFFVYGYGVYHPVSRFFQMAKSGLIDWLKFLFDSLFFLHRISACNWVFHLISLSPMTIFGLSFIIRGALTNMICDFIAVQYFRQMCKRWTTSSQKQHFNSFIPKNVRFCQTNKKRCIPANINCYLLSWQGRLR